MNAKFSLSHLKKLAVCAEGPEAAADLRAHLLANAETYAPLLLADSTTTFCAGVTEVVDDELARRVVETIKLAAKRAREAKIDTGDAARQAAAARVAASIAQSFLAWTIDREPLLAATAGVVTGEDSILRFVAARGEPLGVDAERLRAILKLRKDARAVLYPLSRTPLVVYWGERGQMTFAARYAGRRAKALQTIHLPMIERLDGKVDAVELDQAAE